MLFHYAYNHDDNNINTGKKPHTCIWGNFLVHYMILRLIAIQYYLMYQLYTVYINCIIHQILVKGCIKMIPRNIEWLEWTIILHKTCTLFYTESILKFSFFVALILRLMEFLYWLLKKVICNSFKREQIGHSV